MSENYFIFNEKNINEQKLNEKTFISESIEYFFNSDLKELKQELNGYKISKKFFDKYIIEIMNENRLENFESKITDSVFYIQNNKLKKR